jgi:hypothetical protein
VDSVNLLPAAPRDFSRGPDDVVVIVREEGRVVGWACASNIDELQEIAGDMAARGFVPHRPTAQDAREYGCDWVYEQDEQLSVLQRIRLKSRST